MSNGKGGATLFTMVVVFFVAMFVLYVLYNLGQGLLKFADRNPGIVTVAVLISLFIGFKIFTNDK